MPIDEETCDWLGMPSPVEVYQQHCLLLENEIQELNAHLRKARADIFGLVNMLSEVQSRKDELASYLRQRGAEAAAMRRQIADLTTSNNVNKRDAEELRRVVDEIRLRSTTIV